MPASSQRRSALRLPTTDGEVRYDVAAKPGVANLLLILAAATGTDPEHIAADYARYGPLKDDTATALIEMLHPVRTRFAEFSDDPGETARLVRLGADKAREIASATLERAKTNIGLLNP